MRAQAALLAFGGDQIEPAYTAFAKWLSVDHDRKGTQLGAIAYSNGAVSSYALSCDMYSNGPIRSGSS